MSFMTFYNEKTPLEAIKTRSSKSRKIDIFPKGLTPWFSSKNGHFSNFFYWGNIGQENVFYDILKWKNAFLRYKNKKFKKSKNWYFLKGVDPSLWSKNCHFFELFFLGNIGKENAFYDILERKNSFLGYKNKRFKKSKNWHFYKGVNSWFCPKMTIIPTCFFRQYWQRKCLLRYSRTKKLLSRL